MEIVRRCLRERRYSRRTEEAYVHWIRRYVIYTGRRHPRELGEEEVRRFLSSLAVEERVAASTQNQALSAITFLYDHVLERPLTRIDGIQPARRSQHVPVVLSPREVRAVLSRLKDPVRLCAALMYGSGLRLLECLTLRVKDVDLDRREIVVRDGKGGKDRRTPLAERCIAPLTRVLKEEHDRFRRDERAGVRTAGLPAVSCESIRGLTASFAGAMCSARRARSWTMRERGGGIIFTRARCSEPSRMESPQTTS
jgi:site-specific recombinase XerD